jgi:hypothetical protein
MSLEYVGHRCGGTLHVMVVACFKTAQLNQQKEIRISIVGNTIVRENLTYVVNRVITHGFGFRGLDFDMKPEHIVSINIIIRIATIVLIVVGLSKITNFEFALGVGLLITQVRIS